MFAVAITVFSLWNLLALRELQDEARQGRWDENRLSKSMLLDSLSKPPDFIFVGNSRTLHGIRTADLNKSGINSFNFGLSGMYLTELFWQVRYASKRAKKAVVISVDEKQLSSVPSCPRLNQPETLYGLFQFATMFLGGDCEVRDEFNVERLQSIFPMNLSFRTPEERKESIRNKLEILETKYGVPKAHQLSAFNYIRKDKGRISILLKNGDGYSYADRAREQEGAEIYRSVANRPMEINDHAIHVLKRLISIIQNEGITPIINLEPHSISLRDLNLDLAELRQRLPGVTIIDSQSVKWDRSLWSDYGHFNPKGARAYTKRLARFLRPLLEETGTHPKSRDLQKPST